MEYDIIRSKRKSISIEVKPDGSVIVRAPLRMSEKEIRRFADSHAEWAKEAQARQAERRSKIPERTPEEIAALRESFRAVITEKVNYYAPIMGVEPAGITITSAATRFGSCSGKNRISFSWRLADYPESAVDYVVVHELAHIRHHNHSADFYAFIASVMPDYKEREKLLKR